MLAILLAAGFGKRLEVILQGKPKALLDVGGKTLLQHQLGHLEALNATEVIIITRPEHKAAVSSAVTTAASHIKSSIITGQGDSGFKNFCRARALVEGQRFILLMIDSLFRVKDLEEFKIKCANLRDEFLVGTTPFINDEKPSYVIVNPNHQVVGIGRHCGISEFVSAGIYCCPSDFYDMIDVAEVAGIHSLSEYLGYYVRERKHGIQFTFTEMLDVDTPEDLVLAERWLQAKEHP